jgi:hypothetical protein
LGPSNWLKTSVAKSTFSRDQHRRLWLKKHKIAVLDDYQNVALESADWSVLREPIS